MNKRTSIGRELSLMMAAAIFLFNPDLAVFDILPDIIGHFLMYIALSKLSDVNYHFEEARKIFKYGIYLEMLKLASILFIFGAVSTSERSITILIFTFVFGLANIYIFINAFKQLYEGFFGVGVTQKKSIMTTIFIVARAACSILPELTSLIDNKEYRFIGILRGVGFIICLVFGIIWLVSFMKYISNIKKDREFISTASEKYTNVLSTRPELFLKRRLWAGLSIMMLGFILSIDFYADYFNFIPDFICAGIVFAGIMYLRKYSKKYKLAAVTALAYFAVSAINWGVSVSYFNKYFPGAAMRYEEAATKYSIMVGLEVLDAVIFILMISTSIKFICDIAAIHTAPKNKPLLTREDMFYEEMSRDGKIFFALAILAAVSTVYYTLLLPSNNDVWYIEIKHIVAGICDVAFAAYSFKFINSVQREISSKYKDA